jgi:hypothetical protein
VKAVKCSEFELEKANNELKEKRHFHRQISAAKPLPFL